MVWVKGLIGAGILNLLHLPHFGCYNITDLVVHQFLSLVHNDFLWLQGRILIDETLIHHIIFLPMHWPNPWDGTRKIFEHHLTKTIRGKYTVKHNR